MKRLTSSIHRFFALLSVAIVLSFSTVYGSNSPSFLHRSLALPTIQLQNVTTGLSSPVFVAHPLNDERLFIVEQPGRIQIYSAGTVSPTPFLDLTSVSVTSGGEQGLLGLAFHPNYPSTPYFFVHFTSKGVALPDGTTPNSGDNVIMRFQVSATNPNLANFASGKTLLVMPQPFTNHNGGMIEFGPDGYLYIGKGDGGSGNDPGNRAQNINVLLGKILRIDVNQNVNTAPYYGIPPTNPFAGATAGADEIFLFGLRNPWRFSFDRQTGDLWIGDVGQGAKEEIDRFVFGTNVPGSNLGWRMYEGTSCTGNDPCTTLPNYLPPVAEYGHTGGRCSLTGGYVYRGAAISGLQGVYVYADYCTGEIFALQGTTQTVMLDTAFQITSFGEDRNGELYITAASGGVYKIRSSNPTAASLSLSGRVTNSGGRGLAYVTIVLTGGNLEEPLYARTNSFGYYRFDDLAGGLDYVATPVSKRYSFNPGSQLFTLNDELTTANFVAAASGKTEREF